MHPKLMNFLTPLFAGLLLAGCATDRSVAEAPNIQLTDLTELPAPTQLDEFPLQPLDKVEVRVIGTEVFDGTYLINERGMLNFPFVGTLQAAGRSPQQVSEAIAGGLRGEYVLNPQVVVEPVGEFKPSISMGGQVGQPGTVDARLSQTLMRAINNAGGLGEYAKSDDVLVFRTVNGQTYLGVYNMAAIARGNYPDPALYGGDIVMVGDSASKRLFENIVRGLGVVTSAVFLVDRATR